MAPTLAEIRKRHQKELDARGFARTHKCTRGTALGSDAGAIRAAMRTYCLVDVVDEKGVRGQVASRCHRLEPDEDVKQLHDDVGVLLAEIDRLSALNQ